jgi:hypothetical protein
MTPANLRLAASSVARAPSTRRSLHLCGSRFSAHASAASRSVGGPPLTLEERLEAVLQGVRDHGHAECPVCHAIMRRYNGTVRCSDCLSALA